MASDAPVQKFGEYHLIERIAIGGMAEVWKARAYGLAGFEKTLVIKKILDQLAQNEEFVKLFIYEARIAVLLQHANIVQVFDLGKADGTLYMAMEHVTGFDLGQLCKIVRGKGPFPLSIALFIVSEVLKALRFAHERVGPEGEPLGIVHCDISPHNVLISEAGEVKITDFGISRAAFQATTLHESIRGKYAYMSPEQVEGGDLDARSDLFSLGTLLWEVLAGRRLFKAPTAKETLTRVRRAEAPSPTLYRSDISEELEEFILKALARRPEQRFQSAAEMHEALGALMNREGHRVTNHDLAAFLAQVQEHGSDALTMGQGRTSERSIVVFSAEIDQIDGEGQSHHEAGELVDGWAKTLVSEGAQVWEQGPSGLLAVWVAEQSIDQAVLKAITGAKAAHAAAEEAGYRMNAGLVPGKARLLNRTRRPAPGWELAGPFYLARWMMNLSAHEKHIMTTRGLANRLPGETVELAGKVAVEKDRYIQVLRLHA